MECKRASNECPCTNTGCKNHGVCCDCLKKHLATDSVPFCVFPENNGDKSFKNLYNHLKKRFENE